MSFHTLSLQIGWMAVTVGVAGTYAQFRRITVLGIEGVSVGTWVLFAYMGCFWMAYGIAAHSPELVLGSLGVFPIQLAILFRLQSWRYAHVALQALAFFVLCCVIPTLTWGWAGGVYGTGVAMTINRGPQLMELIRNADASGVSVGAWVLGVVGCAMWITYYVGAHLWAALVATIFAGLANLAIAVLASWRHHQADTERIHSEIFAV